MLRGSPEDVMRKEAESTFNVILKSLRKGSDREIADLLCFLTWLRIDFESHGDLPRELFDFEANGVKKHAMMIQANVSDIVQNNYARTGDNGSYVAGLIVLCSIRAIAYPEFAPKAVEMWKLLERGRSREGMTAFEAFINAVHISNLEAFSAEFHFVPPIFANNSPARGSSHLEYPIANAPVATRPQSTKASSTTRLYFDYGFAEKGLDDAAKFLDNGGNVGELVNGMRLGYMPIADVLGTDIAYFPAIVEYAKQTLNEPERRLAVLGELAEKLAAGPACGLRLFMAQLIVAYGVHQKYPKGGNVLDTVTLQIGLLAQSNAMMEVINARCKP